MSVFVRCDRCKNIINDVNAIHARYIIIKAKNKEDVTLDLCHRCYLDLQIWMSIRPDFGGDR